MNFYLLTVFGGLRRLTVPNIVEIGRFVAEILRFFQIFKMAAATILDLFGAYLDNLFGGLYHSAKFGYDRCSNFYNMKISIFGTFGWKIPIHAPKIGILGQFDPLNGLQYQ